MFFFSIQLLNSLKLIMLAPISSACHSTACDILELYFQHLSFFVLVFFAERLGKCQERNIMLSESYLECPLRTFLSPVAEVKMTLLL